METIAFSMYLRCYKYQSELYSLYSNYLASRRNTGGEGAGESTRARKYEMNKVGSWLVHEYIICFKKVF